jgi:hypothetical protein
MQIRSDKFKRQQCKGWMMLSARPPPPPLRPQILRLATSLFTLILYRTKEVIVCVTCGMCVCLSHAIITIYFEMYRSEYLRIQLNYAGPAQQDSKHRINMRKSH